MSNQTAAEWLFHKLWNEPKDKMVWYALLNMAKQMHKEEIVDAHEIGYINGGNAKKVNGEEYYNETFKSE